MVREDNPRPLNIWVLTDERTGMNNQCLGVAQKLGSNIRIIPIEEFEGPKLSAFLQHESGGGNVPRWPDVIISTGKNTEYPAVRLKKLARDKVFSIKLGAPDKDAYQDFDLVARYDPPALRHIPAQEYRDRVIFTNGVAHGVTPEFVRKGKEMWEEQFSQLPHPRIAVLVGGSTDPAHPFTVAMAKKLGQDVNEMAGRVGGSLIVSDSRRTPHNVTEALFEHIKVPAYLHDTHIGKQSPELVYGMLGTADAIVATGDSMSMVCEACSTGKPVYFYPLPDIEMPYHHYLQDSLLQSGQARPFNGKIENWTYTPWDAAGQIAEEAVKRIREKSRAASL